MPQGLLIKLRPTGPWRIGPDSGARDRVGRVYHSDALFAALSQAFAQLEMLEAWLDATARASAPAVRLSSCFPFQGDTLLVTPPRTLWPPQASSKVRWKGARFVPVSVVETLAQGRTLSDGSWAVDGESECLVPARTPAVPGPFRVSVRSSAAIDRDGESVAPHATACIEFTADAGLWTVAEFADEAARESWTPKLTAAFRLLADSGFGGERSRGWGRAEMPEFTSGDVARLVFRNFKAEEADGQWILSLFHPAEGDAIDWERSDYALTTRGGRVESSAGWGEQKKLTRMVAEGSVLAATALQGSAPDVAPEGFAHPVYRYGYAFALPIPMSVAPKVSE
jgi:CRISPR type III-A-associated RAMP protein Csm4